MVRLLEGYVVDAIDSLDEADELWINRTVRILFPSAGPWRACLQEQFGLTPSLRDQIVAVWAQSRTVADEQGVKLTPAAFATMVVEENFSDALEMLTTEMDDQWTARLDANEAEDE